MGKQMAVWLSFLLFLLGNPYELHNLNSVIASSIMEAVCAQTHIPNSCLDALGSDSRSKSANLEGLGFISIDLALKNATDTVNYIESLLQNADETTYEDALRVCQSEYNDMISDLNQAKGYMAAKNYEEVSFIETRADNHAAECEGSFKQVPTQSPLTQNNNDVHLLMEILMAVTQLLLR